MRVRASDHSLLIEALLRLPRRSPAAISFAGRVRVWTVHPDVFGRELGVGGGEVRGVGVCLGSKERRVGVGFGGFPSNGARGGEASGGRDGRIVLRSISCVTAFTKAARGARRTHELRQSPNRSLDLPAASCSS